MILVDIYRVLIACQRGKDFFERYNILLQLWIIGHLYQSCILARFIHYQSDYITSHAKKVEKYEYLEGVNAWMSAFTHERQIRSHDIFLGSVGRKSYICRLFALSC